MGANPEMAILRRFGSLNALNLLYLQAELTHLEAALEKEIQADFESGTRPREIYATHWESFCDSATAEGGNPTQWNLMLQIRGKLKEYNEALHLQHKIAAIGEPNKEDLKLLQTWMNDPTASGGNIYLLGEDRHVWEQSDPSERELVSINPRQHETYIVRLISDVLLGPYHLLAGRFFKKWDTSELHRDMVQYSQGALNSASAVIGTVFASMLLVGSIVVLYTLTSMEKRLLAIGLFTTGFSLGLCLCTNGRMVEIFSATAAFAAVQVVFVGSTGLEGNTSDIN